MQHFDSDYAEQLIERVQCIPGDAAPAWGVLRPDALIEHFIWILCHAIGRSRRVPGCGTWFQRNFVKPLLLRGYIAMPKYMCLPEPLSRQGVIQREPGDIETLDVLIAEYLGLVQADELDPAPHPFFGPLSIDEWDRMHVRHFEHHLKQFGV